MVLGLGMKTALLGIGMCLVQSTAAATLYAKQQPNPLVAGRNKPFDLQAHLADLEYVVSKYGGSVATRQGQSAPSAEDQPGQVKNYQFPQYGAWLAEVEIGSPGQKFLVVLDSGSSDFWVDGIGKGISGTGYDPSKSSTSSDTGRTFNDFYGDGSQGISGDLYTDNVNLGGLVADKQIFGRGTQIVGGITNGLDGILGLAFQSLSSFDSPNPFQTIVNQGKAKNLFGASMGNNGSAEFTFGYIDDSKYTGDIAYEGLHDEHYWTVEMSLAWNGKKGSNFRGALDTGTTLMYISPDAAETLYSAIGGTQIPWWETNGQQGFYTVPCDLSGSIDVQIGNSVFKLPITDNFFGGTYGNQCIGNIIGQSIGDPSLVDAVIGDLFLTNYYTVFDGDNNRVGLAAAAPGTSVTTLSG